MIYIGIDTGVNTGLAIWDGDQQMFLDVDCVKIHTAMSVVEDMVRNNRENIFVRFEDARMRKWVPYHGASADRARLQGAGSIKRDAVIWQDFLTDLNAHFEMIAPKNNVTKLTQEQFARITKWQRQTNEHGRDAAMLVFGLATQKSQLLKNAVAAPNDATIKPKKRTQRNGKNY